MFDKVHVPSLGTGEGGAATATTGDPSDACESQTEREELTQNRISTAEPPLLGAVAQPRVDACGVVRVAAAQDPRSVAGPPRVEADTVTALYSRSPGRSSGDKVAIQLQRSGEAKRPHLPAYLSPSSTTVQDRRSVGPPQRGPPYSEFRKMVSFLSDSNRVDSIMNGKTSFPTKVETSRRLKKSFLRARRSVGQTSSAPPSAALRSVEFASMTSCAGCLSSPMRCAAPRAAAVLPSALWLCCPVRCGCAAQRAVAVLPCALWLCCPARCGCAAQRAVPLLAAAAGRLPTAHQLPRRGHERGTARPGRTDGGAPRGAGEPRRRCYWHSAMLPWCCLLARGTAATNRGGGEPRGQCRAPFIAARPRPREADRRGGEPGGGARAADDERVRKIQQIRGNLLHPPNPSESRSQFFQRGLLALEARDGRGCHLARIGAKRTGCNAFLTIPRVRLQLCEVTAPLDPQCAAAVCTAAGHDHECSFVMINDGDLCDDANETTADDRCQP
eukprot:gene14103-biopygen5747